ncbi:hypothetical protein GGR55DRAFT_634967 [Xylaria sp. FL0064]|nr:hypothetical protein GGR55DRAFT_634967 [Xylaria sp. FL0064]
MMILALTIALVACVEIVRLDCVLALVRRRTMIATRSQISLDWLLGPQPTESTVPSNRLITCSYESFLGSLTWYDGVSGIVASSVTTGMSARLVELGIRSGSPAPSIVAETDAAPPLFTVTGPCSSVSIATESYSEGPLSTFVVVITNGDVCCDVVLGIDPTGQFVAGQEHADMYRSLPVPHAAIARAG